MARCAGKSFRAARQSGGNAPPFGAVPIKSAVGSNDNACATVATIGAISFLTTSLTVINNKGNGSVFGYAFFPAILSLVTWTIATSIAVYRQHPPSGAA